MTKLKIVFWILIAFSISEAYKLDGNLCRTIDLGRQESGTLHVIFLDSYTDCTIKLIPRWHSSVVLSIIQYSVPSHHLLSVEDSDGYKISLLDQGLFSDNKKSIISDGTLKIRYVVPFDRQRYLRTQTEPSTLNETEPQQLNDSIVFEENDTLITTLNETAHSSVALGFFHFKYTQVGNQPCGSQEFACQNGKCLFKSYVCSGYNRCGDNSDNHKCGPGHQEVTKTPLSQPLSKKLIIIICISSGLLTISLLLIIYIFVNYILRSKRPEDNDSSTPPLQSVSANVPPRERPGVSEEVPTSVCSRVHHFFNQMKADRVEEDVQTLPSERFEVPSMYPSLQPSAPEYASPQSHENRGFSGERE